MRVMVIVKATKEAEEQNTPLGREGAPEIFEAMELVAGFWIWQVRSMEEAVEWAKRCPNPMPGPSDLEIRPIWEPEDFEPEITAQVNGLRDKIADGEVSSQPVAPHCGHGIRVNHANQSIRDQRKRRRGGALPV